MKEKLMKLLKAKQEQRDALNAQMIESDTKEERAAIGETLKALGEEIAEVEKMLEEVDKPADGQGEGAPEGNGEGERKFNPMATKRMSNGKGEARKDEDPLATMEYRKAFMEYVKSGAKSAELRYNDSDDTNQSSDLGVLIPQTVVQEIIKGVEKVYGQLYSRVKKTNIKGGVKYPIGSFGATFKRVTTPEPKFATERQNGGEITGYVEFSYNVGEIRLAQTFLSAVLSVPVFEAELAKVIVEAYVKAMDYEIMKGTASKAECEGILTEAAKSSSRIPAANIISFTAAEMADWTKWQKKLFAKIPLSMRGLRPEFAMTADTWEGNILTMVDTNNNPIAREVFNPNTGDEMCKFKGRDVVLVEEDILASFDSASAGDYFAMYWVPEKAYAINTNYEFAVRRYYDEEYNQWVDKALVVNDGKVLDPKYIYLLKKA